LLSEELQEKINEHCYWDLPLDELRIDNFLNNVEISYFHEKKIKYSFNNCYKIIFNHCIDYKKEKGLLEEELPPCFFRDISVEETKIQSGRLYKVQINAYPIDLEILCKEIRITEE